MTNLIRELECVEVAVETHDVRTFTFRCVAPESLTFRAGQHMSLLLPHPRGRLTRTYTISSSPSRTDKLTITAKRQTDSVGTAWMFENLRPGSTISALGPSGDFTLDRSRGDSILFISAGSGITPMLSMTRWLAVARPDTDIVFLSAVRSPRDLLFGSELDRLGTLMPRLATHYFLEEGTCDGPGQIEGRIDGDKLTALVPGLGSRDVFCCGPQPFMAAVRTILGARGFDMDRYYEESFQPSNADALAVHSPSVGKVSFIASGVVADCPAGRSILQLALEQNMLLDHGCQVGACGACKIRKISGTVRMEHKGAINDAEIADGMILACCSYPLGHVEVDA